MNGPGLLPLRQTLIVLVGLAGLTWASITCAQSQRVMAEPGMPDPLPIELIQASLKSLGHYAGSLDGLIGPQTRAALDSWQLSTGLEATGELTRDQQQTLVLASATADPAEARELLERFARPRDPGSPASSEDPKPTAAVNGPRIDAAGSAQEGDRRLQAPDRGIDSADRAVAVLSGRVDAKPEHLDRVVVRLDALDERLELSDAALEDQKTRVEDNSIRLYENLIGIDAIQKELTLMRSALALMQSAQAEADTPVAAADGDRLGLLLPVLLCLLVPLAMVIDQRVPDATPGEAKTGPAGVAWVLVTWFAGGATFFLIGFGIMYGPSVGGVIGDPNPIIAQLMLAAPVDLPPGWLERLVPGLVLAGIVATVACASVPDLLTKRGHLLVAVVVGGLVYPLFGHWIAMPGDIVEQSGWLAGSALACPGAPTVVVALLGGVLALSLTSGLGLFHARASAGPADPAPAGRGTTGAMLLWIAWIGVILIANADCFPLTALPLSLAGAGGGAAIGALLVHGASDLPNRRQDQLPFVVLAGIVATPISGQELSLVELAVIGALAGVAASLLIRFFDARTSTDVRLASSLVAGGILGVLGPVVFGPTGFLFVHSVDVLAPQLLGVGAALLLGLVAGRTLAWTISSADVLRTAK